MPSPFSLDFFDRFFLMVERRTGIAVTARQKATLKKVVEAMRAELSDADREAYLSSLLCSPVSGDFWDEILGHLTVGETYFFRDASQMEALRETILPSLVEKNRETLSLSILSAGCATGEEPYTLAMMLTELIPQMPRWKIRLIATDINPKMLAAAGRARFREWSFRNTDHSVRAKYFSREKDLYALDPEIVKMVSFQRVNLVEDDVAALFPDLDLVLCRNVVVYLCEQARKSVVKKLFQSLGNDGWLILGASEGMAALSQENAAIHTFPGAIAYQKKQELPRAWQSRAGKTAAPEMAMLRPAAEPEPGPEAADLLDARQDVVSGKGEEPELCEVQRLADSGKVMEASALLSGILERNPEKVEVHFLSGILAMARKDVPAAAEHLKKTIFLSSGMAVAHGLLADLYRHAGMRRLARRHYEWALSLVEAAAPESIVSFSGGLSARSMTELFKKNIAETEDPRP